MPRLIRKRKTVSDITLGDRACDARQWDVAARHYRLALARNSDRPPIWLQYGHVLKESGKYQHAEAAYRRAIAGDPGLADAELHLGHVLKIQRRWVEAAAAYMQAFVLDPTLTAAREELERNELGRVNSVQLAEVLKVGKPVPIPHTKLTPIGQADMARDSALWELAAQLYRKVLHRNPRNPPIWIEYGHALAEAGDLAGAEDAYRTATAYDPTNSTAQFFLGRVLRRQDKEGAVPAQLRAFVLNPSCTQALEELRHLGWAPAHVTELKRIAAPNGGPLPPTKS